MIYTPWMFNDGKESAYVESNGYGFSVCISGVKDWFYLPKKWTCIRLYLTTKESSLTQRVEWSGFMGIRVGNTRKLVNVWNVVASWVRDNTNDGRKYYIGVEYR